MNEVTVMVEIKANNENKSKVSELIDELLQEGALEESQANLLLSWIDTL